jgi:hypothetical protein
MWHLTSIAVGRTNSLDLYVRQDGPMIEVHTVDLGDMVCLEAHKYFGRIESLSYDQHTGGIPWKKVDLPEFCSTPMFDTRNKDYESANNQLNQLVYCIANSVNAALKDKGFSRYATKVLVGKWRNGIGELTLNGDKSYTVSGKLAGAPYQPPMAGIWGVARNMLYLMDSERNKGVRVAIQSISPDVFRLNGENSELSIRYDREKEE